jgi:Transposase DDE domain
MTGRYRTSARGRLHGLWRRGLTRFTRIRQNMKSLPLAMPDKILLNARNMAETIIGSIKQFSSLNLPKHRLPLNAFLHLLAAITAYQINAIKLKSKLPSTYSLAIPA